MQTTESLTEEIETLTEQVESLTANVMGPLESLTAQIHALPDAIQRMIMPLALAPVLDACARAQHKSRMACVLDDVKYTDW